MASFSGGSRYFDETELQKEISRLKRNSLKSMGIPNRQETSVLELGIPEVLPETASPSPVTLQDVREAEFQTDLQSLIFSKHHITLERMHKIVDRLREFTLVDVVSFEGCDFDSQTCKPLATSEATNKQSQIKFLDLTGSYIIEVEDWEHVGQAVNRYSVRGLRLFQCQLNSWTFRSFCSGIVKTPIQMDEKISSGIIDLRGNDIVFDDETLFSLESLVSSRRFNMFCFDGFTLKINNNQKVLLDMKPDERGIHPCVWGSIVPLCQVHGMLISSSHDLAINPNEFARILKRSEYKDLKELCMQMTENNVQHYGRAVNLVILLEIEDFIISYDGSFLHKSCLEIILKTMIENRYMLRSFGLLFEDETTLTKFVKIIGDILIHCKVKRFLLSAEGENNGTLVDKLKPILEKLARKKYYKLDQLIVKHITGKTESDISSNEEIDCDDVPDMEGEDMKDGMIELCGLVYESIIIELPNKVKKYLLHSMKKNLEGNNHFGVMNVEDGISIYVKKFAHARQSVAGHESIQNAISNMEVNVCFVKKIDLSGKVLAEKYLHLFSSVLRFCEQLTELVLINCQLEDRYVSLISDALSVYEKKMILLDLSSNPLLAKLAATAISNLLRKRQIENIKVLECGLERWHEEIILPGMLNMSKEAGTTITYAEDQVTVAVDNQGATIDFSTKGCYIEVPPKAVKNPTRLTFRLTHPKKCDNFPQGTFPATSILTCLPTGLKFDKFINVKLQTWIRRRSSSTDERQLNLHVLTREKKTEKWNKESTIRHGDSNCVQFQIDHFSDFDVVVDTGEETNNIQANYCNMLFKSTTDPLTKENHIILSKFVPNNQVAIATQLQNYHAQGMSLVPLGTNEINISPEDQISISLTHLDEPGSEPVRIQPSTPTCYTGAQILEQSASNAKFTVRLVNRSNQDAEKLSDLWHKIVGTTRGSFNDPVNLRWRPITEEPTINHHTYVNNFNINGSLVNIFQEDSVTQNTPEQPQQNVTSTTNVVVEPLFVDEAAIDADGQEECVLGAYNQTNTRTRASSCSDSSTSSSSESSDEDAW